MNRQQRFQALAQGGVMETGAIQEGIALVRRLFQRGSQKHFFSILRR